LCFEIPIAVAFFHNMAPWSDAHVIKPIIAL
jgi:hypothetical protein